MGEVELRDDGRSSSTAASSLRGSAPPPPLLHPAPPSITISPMHSQRGSSECVGGWGVKEEGNVQGLEERHEGLRECVRNSVTLSTQTG